MAKLFVDIDKYADGEGPPVVEAYHSALKALVRRRLDECKGDWKRFVFDRAYDLVTTEDIAEIEGRLLATGYRFTSSAMISLRERPDAYKPVAGIGFRREILFRASRGAQRSRRCRGASLARAAATTSSSTAHNPSAPRVYFRSSERVLQSCRTACPRTPSPSSMIAAAR